MNRARYMGIGSIRHSASYPSEKSLQSLLLLVSELFVEFLALSIAPLVFALPNLVPLIYAVSSVAHLKFFSQFSRAFNISELTIHSANEKETSKHSAETPFDTLPYHSYKHHLTMRTECRTLITFKAYPPLSPSKAHSP